MDFKLKKAVALVTATASTIASMSFSSLYTITATAETSALLEDTFEDGYGSWKGVGSTVERSSDQAYEGDYSLYCYDRTASWGAPRCSVSKLVESGKSYGMSCYVYYDDETGGQSQKFSIQYVYTDSDGNERYGWVTEKDVKANTWTQISVSSHTIPSGATGVTLYVQASTMSTFYLDNVTLTGEPKSDTSTEDGFSNNFDDGKASGWTGRGSATSEVTTKQAYSGNYSLFTSGRTQLWNGATANKNDVITAGGYYSVGTYVYYDGDEWSDTQKFSINLQYDADGKENYYTIATVTVNKGEWTYVGSELTIPSNGTNFFVYIQTGYTSAPKEQDLMDFYVDDVSATRLPDPAIQTDIASLKDVYADYFKIGCAVTESELENNASKDLIKYQYNSMTLGNELKPDSVLDKTASLAYAEKTGDYTNPQISLKNADKLLKFAAENNIPVRGHVLCWHSQTPDWFFKENFDADGDWVDVETMNTRLENYIKNLMTSLEENYPDVDFYAWDVVNEAASDSGTIRTAGSNNAVSGQSAWVAVYGDQSYIRKAFEYARKYAPEGSKLYYNDYNEYNPTKQDYIIETIKDLKLVEDGLLDGIGMQSHISMSYPSTDLYKSAIQKYADLGVDIQITELDVSVKSNEKEDQLALAQRYRDVFNIYKEMSDNISAVVLWGITDSTSWIGGYPLLFDKDYQAKDAFYAVADLTSPIDVINKVTAYKNDGTETDIEKCLEMVNSESIQNAGSFRVTYSDNVLTVKVDSNSDCEYKIVGDVESSGKLTKGENIITIKTEEKLSGSINFDIELGGSAWNDEANFTDKSGGTLGKISFSSQPEYGEAVKGTAVIDGKIDDSWANAKTFEVSKEQVGSDGATAVGRVMWDNENLYILMEVTDPLLSAESANAYEQDCVEVFFDENNNKSTAYEEDDIQCRVNFENYKTVTDGLSTDRFVSATSKTSTGYIVEIAIPSTLGGLSKNQVIGFDMQVNDDADGDGKRDNISIWNDMTGKGYENPSVFGVVKLVDSGEYELGDVNNDGKINVSDVVALQKYILKQAKTIDFKAADVMSDKKINVVDLAVLKEMVNG